VNDKIAVILLDGYEEYNICTPIYNGIEKYASENNIRNKVKYYSSDGTSKCALQILKQVYNEGIRKVVGFVTSQEIYGDVEDFLKEHPDIVLINGSATSKSLDDTINNIYYFVPNDDQMATHIANLLFIRNKDIENVFIIHRNDQWGNFYSEGIQTNVTSNGFLGTVKDYPYEIASLNNTLDDVNDELDDSSCIIFIGMDEIINYIDYVKDNEKFKIKHYGTDGVSFNNVVYENDEYRKFFTDTEFESIFYYGYGEWSDKRKKLAENFNTSMYTFTYYDAMDCAVNGIKRNNYYGTSGYIEFGENNRRIFGTTNSIGIINTGLSDIWYRMSIMNTNIKFNDIDMFNIFDVNKTYDITFNEDFTKYPVELSLIDTYGNTTSYNIEEGDVTVKCPISMYSVFNFNDEELIVSSLSKDEGAYASVSGVNYVARLKGPESELRVGYEGEDIWCSYWYTG